MKQTLAHLLGSRVQRPMSRVLRSSSLASRGSCRRMSAAWRVGMALPTRSGTL